MMARLGDVCNRASSNIAQKDLEGRDGDYPIYGASGYIKHVDFYQQEKPYIAVVKDGAGIGRVMKLPAKSSVIGTMQYILPNSNVDIGYLAYAMENMNLTKYFSGATIPHIYFKDYQREELPLPSIDRQRSIATVLDKISSLIAKRRLQIEKLDELVKSRFIELFGDPVANSFEWKQTLLREVTKKIGSGATPRGGKESYQAEGITLIRSMNVHDGRFEYKDLAHITDEQAAQLDNVTVEDGDVFINITGASVARSCIVPTDVLPARVNQHVAIIRCVRDWLHPSFAYNMFLNDRFKGQLLDIGESGGATRQAITKQQLENLTVILPPLELQEQFAAFVEQTDKSKYYSLLSYQCCRLAANTYRQEWMTCRTSNS